MQRFFDHIFAYYDSLLPIEIQGTTPNFFSQKSWYLGIRNGPIARGFWNLNQSIEQNGKNLQL